MKSTACRRRRASVVVTVTLVASLATLGCGSDPAASKPDAPSADAAAEIVAIDSTDSADTNVDSTGGADSADTVLDTAATCPGGAGCSCGAAVDCDSGLCLETQDGKRCATTCVDACPTGYRCATVPQAADVVQVCVASDARLCSPCSQSADCNVPGITDSRCVDRGDAGAFCGTACSSGADCGDGYQCKAAIDVEGNTSNQCVPIGDDAAAACLCSPNAVAIALVASCNKAIVTPEGEFSCAGSLQCKVAGEAATCTAATPAPETCNGKDDDCDGKTDDEACDDDQPCTQDACDASSGKCTSKPLGDGTACDADGSVCTVADACSGGQCQAGKAKDCDDGNPCTTAACDATKGCSQSADIGAPCSDDNPCTLGDVCAEAGCQPGQPKPCTSADACMVAKCSVVDGKCVFSEAVAGIPCDDGNACTAQDACKGGDCQGQGVSCDDGNSCTAESCVPSSGCASKPSVVGACDDGDACTSDDACAAGACKGVTLSCDDGSPCTQDACNGKTGCQHLPAAGSCDDGDPCSADDACDGGKCQPGKGICACKTSADCKDDDDLCNGVPVCVAEGAGTVCKLDPKSVVVCDVAGDGPCKVTACEPKTGACVTSAKAEQTPCDDGDACSVGDACASGVCVAGKAVCACKGDADCKDDGDLCNGTPICDTGALPYVCKVDAKTIVSCDPNAGGACTVTACKASDGKCATSAKQDGTSCSDGDACTGGDGCQLGKCVGGAVVGCDDGNPCTADACDKAKGCSNVATPGATVVCYDGPDGTVDVGTCVAGKQACDAAGKLGPCQGAVLPAKAELCDGKDDDCDGTIDEGCKPNTVAISQAPLLLRGQADGKGVDAVMQTGPSGDSVGGKFTLRWSLEALWRLWWK